MLSQFQTDTFSQLGLQLAARLNLASTEKVRIYETPQLALFDTTLSLQQFLMHKPQIGIVKKGSSLIESMTPMWLRNQTPLQIKTDQQTWLEYIESLSKETNFVVWASENEITGEVIIPIDEVAEIHKRLAEKRIYSIQIQHQLKKVQVKLDKYSVLIHRPNLFSNHLTYSVLAEKVKSPSVMGEFQNLAILKEKSDQFTSQDLVTSQNQDLETNWLVSLPDQKFFYYDYFATPCERITDRLVFWFQDMSGLSVKQKLGLSDTQAFAPSQLPFWYLQFWNHWWKEAESEKLLRGLLIVNARVVIDDSRFTSKMEQAIAEIRSLSQWSHR